MAENGFHGYAEFSDTSSDEERDEVGADTRPSSTVIMEQGDSEKDSMDRPFKVRKNGMK